MTAALESMAKVLPSLSVEGIESMLLSFDAMVAAGGQEARAAAGRVLREAADACADAAARDRLLLAADAVEAGRACGSKEVTAAYSVTAEEWEARGGEAALPPPPGPDLVQEQEEDAEGEVPLDAPPALPRLRVPHFFPGLEVYVAREFTDLHGRLVPAGIMLRLLRRDSVTGGYTLSFLDRTVQLRSAVPGHAAIIENAANEWFQPVPSRECLQALWEVVDDGLNEKDPDDNEFVEGLIWDVTECEDWLFGRVSGDPPKCETQEFAAEVYGPYSSMAAWVDLLYAGVAYA